MGTEELEYEWVDVCFVAEAKVKGRKRPVRDKGEKKEPPPRKRKQVLVLRGDAGGSISPEEEPIVLAARRGLNGEVELTIDEAARLPFQFPDLHQALRRSRA